MSYILEALKKSEEERSKAELVPVDVVQSVFGPVGKGVAGRSLWLPISIGLVLVICAVWLGFQFLKMSAKISANEAAASQAAIVSLTASDNQNNGISEALEERVSLNGSQQSIEAQKQSVQLVSTKTQRFVDSDDIGELRGRQLNVDGSVSGSESRSRVSLPEDSVASALSTSGASSLPDNAKSLTSKLEEGFELIEPRAASLNSTVAESEYSYSSLPYLNELDSSARSDIPEMEFSSHMYSSLASYRSVVINGASLKQGDSFGRDLFVEAITEEGVVLDRDGLQFRVNVMQQWTFQ